MNPNSVHHAVPWKNVRLQGGFWGRWQEVLRTATLSAEYRQLQETGRLGSLRLTWKPGDPSEPHIFWDSDIAKWAEAASYALALWPDAVLEAQVEEIVDLYAAAQWPDGYVNTHFTLVEPEKRWTNLRDMHELYCAGHLFEFAVAHYRATGRRKMLEVARRYADHIEATFGRGEGQKRGYPGHEEIELALVKLYRVTGEPRYLELAQYFIEERGQKPHYFDLEAIARGEDPARYWAGGHDYSQSHIPVREQREAVGHAVRAMYLYSGAADLVAETGDEGLMEALRHLWESVTRRRMYITGGIGSSAVGERFSYDYDLPNDTAYAETCATVGLALWAHRLLKIERRGEYGDTLERALYNGILSGISLDGTRFFYANPLEVHPGDYLLRPYMRGWSSYRIERQEWFPCACCPPNVARLLASLGEYLYSQTENEVAVHLYASSQASLVLNGVPVTLTQETDYPWDGAIRLTIVPQEPVHFGLALRIPGWCREASLRVNGHVVPIERGGDYVRIARTWRERDVLSLELAMPVERIEAHPFVRHDNGRVALQRGPLIYCLEEADNGPALAALALPREATLLAHPAPGLLGGVVLIEGEGLRREVSTWDGMLYRPGGTPLTPAPVRAIPYYAWANRGIGEMSVWIRER
ncbi:MAG: glycoside hydrolase family 127 protein [Chloroflexi bacterium]|nr:glycoside hydrolase family 127 protein [Chloroflexota bacterium]